MMMFYGPAGRDMVMAAKAKELIDLIQTKVDPGYWDVNGGQGKITFFGPSQSIVVRASAEMHYQLGSPGIFGR